MIKWMLPMIAMISVLAISPATADDAAAPPAALRAIADEDSRALFLRCCWALGRAGFHYCDHYGVCTSDPKATCRGTGAAEGMTETCAVEPPDLPDKGG